MSEKFHNISVAYTKGSLAANERYPTNPYGATKRQLKQWWFAGLTDGQNNNLDETMIVELSNRGIKR
jgi:hypothetical protein